VQIDEKVAAEFALRNLREQSLTECFGQPAPAEVIRPVRAGQGIAAAQQYQLATGAQLPECHFAVQVAQRFLAGRALS
jgi:hypothetical protein